MNILRFSLWMFLFIFLMTFIDIVGDFMTEGAFDTHLAVELSVAILAVFAFIILWFSSWQQQKEHRQLLSKMQVVQANLTQTQAHRRKLMGELSIVIQQQFTEWCLTPSEKEVSLLLLKGLSLEQIASVRNCTEKTVRQHASNLYKKAGVSGRHELVAFFFEDLLREPDKAD